MNEIDESKTKYFVIAIILLIVLGVILIIHFNNKSLVSGDTDKTTKKTTEKITEQTTEVVTTKKVEEKEEDISISNQDVYKSVIDENNNLIYNYKLTDEITNTDIIVSTPLEVNEFLKSNNVIGIYDISLYDMNMIKKTVSNSLINISIPITGNLVGYDNYKVVYIDENDNITDEEFNTTVSDGYINFSTTHLSKYGIIGTKTELVPLNNVVSLDEKVNIDILYNDELVNKDETLYITKYDKLMITVDGVDNYEVYYGLKNSNGDINYIRYIDEVIFDDITPYEEVKLMVKVVVGEDYIVDELNTVKVYDIIFDNNVLETEKNDENTNIGIIETDDEEPYLYNDEDMNNDIVVKEDENINIEDKAVVNLYGNIYLVEETDINNLELNGYLFIDTDERINSSNGIDMSNLYRITIYSEIFNYNGTKYTYRKDEYGNIIINRYVIEEDSEEETLKREENVIEDFTNIFKVNEEEQVVISIDEETNGLVIDKEESQLLD